MADFNLLLCLMGCYLLGCFTVGYYLVRWHKGIDLRQRGSGSTGAMNAGRELGPSAFVLTLMGDAGKGALAVWFAHLVSASSTLALLGMIAVVLGHIWPVQLGFRGGKGVAPTLGAMLVYDVRLTLLLVGLFALVYLATRRWMLSGLGSITLAPLVAAGIGRSGEQIAGLACLVILIGIAHRDNLRSLWHRNGK